VSHLLRHVFEPGFFHSGPVRTAIIVGALAALVSGAIGVFTVMRGQSFAGEALADIGAAGGSGAFLVGVGPLWGFVVIGVIAAAAMDLIGVQRPRGRDLATGIVLGAGLGLAALFLYFDSTYHNTTGAAVTILFGSVFAIPSATIPLVLVLGLAVLAILLTIHRSLLLSSVSPEMAAARGIPVRAVGLAYLLALSLSISLCALTIGAILSTALLVGPAAAALRVTRRPGAAVLTAGALGVGATWLGILLAYDSYYWPPSGRGWPVSFFVVSLVFVIYLLCGLPAWRAARAGRATTAGPQAAS
jgi:zinc/manganese transport system permease protein